MLNQYRNVEFITNTVQALHCARRRYGPKGTCARGLNHRERIRQFRDIEPIYWSVKIATGLFIH